MKCAHDNGYTVIRLLQLDVLNDNYNYYPELYNHIVMQHNNPDIIYICKNNEYDIYINSFK